MNAVSEQSFEKALDKIRELSKQNATLKRELAYDVFGDELAL